MDNPLEVPPRSVSILLLNRKQRALSCTHLPLHSCRAEAKGEGSGKPREEVNEFVVLTHCVTGARESRLQQLEAGAWHSMFQAVKGW